MAASERPRPLCTLVLPAVVTIELIAALPIVPRWAVWLLRLILALATPRILLHGSVYLQDPGWPALALLAACATALAGVWSLLLWLSRRAPGLSIPLTISLATLSAGVTVMMAGYLKGAAAALPLAATLAATAGVSPLVVKRADNSAFIGVGTIGLFSLLLIGRCFGRITTGSAVAIMAAPLLCWVTELPFLRHRPIWLVESLRLMFVALLLAVVLMIAKCEFDRVMAPLLSTRLLSNNVAHASCVGHVA